MSVVAPAGFVASGLAAGIKADGSADLALVATTDGRAVPAAAVFTSNRLAAAPVRVSRAHLSAARSHASAVVLNSGCANAATGSPGVLAAERTCETVAHELGVVPEQVLVCSTGPIGTDLPIDAVVEALPGLVKAAGGTPEHGLFAARAIMTTDTRPKQVVVRGDGVVVGGMAKGAAMIAPNMATMLAVLTTDAAVPADMLSTALSHAVEHTFNRLSLDGCTSTNDTVIALASGAGRPVDEGTLSAMLTSACAHLAGEMARDTEGGSKVVRVRVEGAGDDGEALRAARAVAESSLVKASWAGEDANWGRVASELGASGAQFDEARLSISYGPVTVCRGGLACGHDEAELAAVLAGPELEVCCELGLGDGTGTILSADLTPSYVELNMGRS